MHRKQMRDAGQFFDMVDSVMARRAPVRCGKWPSGAPTPGGCADQTPVRESLSMPRGTQMLIVLINILVIIVVGAILFYLIDRFVRDGRLANLLKILVALICLLAILQRLLPALGIGFF
jgi:hypothetical protein